MGNGSNKHQVATQRFTWTWFAFRLLVYCGIFCMSGVIFLEAYRGIRLAMKPEIDLAAVHRRMDALVSEEVARELEAGAYPGDADLRRHEYHAKSSEIQREILEGERRMRARHELTRYIVHALLSVAVMCGFLLVTILTLVVRANPKWGSRDGSKPADGA